MGLLRGRSRKIFNPFEGRTGDVVKIEKHETQLINFTSPTTTGPTDTVILNVPQDFKLRILKYSVLVNELPSPPIVNFYELRADGLRYDKIYPTQYDRIQGVFDYENAIIASNNLSFYTEQSVGSGTATNNVTVEILYVLEPSARGYLVRT